MGEVQQLDFGTGSARFDPNVDVYYHLVCTSCGKVRDLTVEFPGVHVPPGTEQVFTVDHDHYLEATPLAPETIASLVADLRG